MDFYELLERLVQKSSCGETEKRDMLAVIAGMRRINSFGIAGLTVTQDHDCSPIFATGQCAHCGRQMQPPAPRKSRGW